MRSLSHTVLSLILCICLLLSLSSCSFFKGVFKSDNGEETGTGGTSGPVDVPETVDRAPGVYSFLILNEGQTEGTLASIFLLALNSTESGGASFLQIPIRTYISGGSFASIYSASYSAAVTDGNNTDIAREKAIAAVKNAVVSKMCIGVDYHICFTYDGFIDAIDSIGGVTVDVPFVVPSGKSAISSGRQTLDGVSAASLVSYSGFSVASQIDVFKVVLGAYIARAKQTVTSSNLSLFVLELRNSSVTDVPYNAGEDIFFMRKLLYSSSDSVRFSTVASQSIAISTGLAHVVYKSALCSQIIEFLALYSVPDISDKFDPGEDLNDKTNAMINTIYNSAGTVPAVFDLTAVAGGAIALTK